MAELPNGIRRLTFPLPTGPKHVHVYLVPSADGWTVVDTGLGLPDLEERWQGPLAALAAPVARVIITHFHPDHVGGGRDLAELTGAGVYQGELDYEQCQQVWGSADWEVRIAGWFARNGVPKRVADELLEHGDLYRPFIRYFPDPEPLRPGDRPDGWEVQAFPGHADGHLCLLKDGLMIAGDHLLPDVTPSVGLYPEARPDPLGDYLASLERTIELAPRLALPGHGEPIEDPAGRAAEIIEHHRHRLDELAAALGPEPQSGYTLSLALFGRALPPAQRRFAVAETLSHLERLVCSGRAARSGDGEIVTYTAN